MRYIYSPCTDPYFNLASEEYLLRHTRDEFFYLWRNDNAIIVGRNQNTLSEIDYDYVKQHNIKVVRRQTGGGAVYHDLENLNFTFIVNENDSFSDFHRFLVPIMEALQSIGIQSEFSGRNDLLIHGKKFSGNAQCKYKDRVMHHGTLLFKSNLSTVSAALKPKDLKFQDKSVKSVASRITNISQHLPPGGIQTVLELKDAIFKVIAAQSKKTGQEMEEKASASSRLSSQPDVQAIDGFTSEEISAIEKLRDEKYSTWNWNFGSSPRYGFFKAQKFPGGLVELSLHVENGSLAKVSIHGDFFGKEDLSLLTEALTGLPHKEEDLTAALNHIGLERFMTQVPQEEFVKMFF